MYCKGYDIVIRESYKDTIRRHPASFYRSLQRSIKSLNEEITFRDFPNLTSIPNHLKSPFCSEDFRIVKFNIVKTVKLNDILPPLQRDVNNVAKKVTMLRIHVTQTSVKLIREDHTWEIKNKSLYILVITNDYLKGNADAYKDILISVSNAPAVIGIETICSNRRARPFVMHKVEIIPSNVIVTIESRQLRKSYINQQLSREEIKRKIVFVAATFMKSHANHLHPASVAVINYDGIVVIDQLITPSWRIIQFDSEVHGITKSDVLGQLDEYEFYKRFRPFWKGKILVCLDMNRILCYLKIDFCSIMGIRDLSSASCLARHMPDRGNKYYHLPNLSWHILKKNMLTNFRTAVEDASIIREIYLKFENEWQDDLPFVFSDQLQQPSSYKKSSMKIVRSCFPDYQTNTSLKPETCDYGKFTNQSALPQSAGMSSEPVNETSEEESESEASISFNYNNLTVDRQVDDNMELEHNQQRQRIIRRDRSTTDNDSECPRPRCKRSRGQ